ncbi:hypothetical protein C1H46_001353 [Malus baccata]|uniref:Uncharacterized protein n=1 Tax=Malus baccata TaxID=106549 RepID=A0A540NPL3_MALBA|nr:hypothetical protein C1H46_001353 [Malus baccata]
MLRIVMLPLLEGALDISRFQNCPALSNECSENSGGPALSQGSGISEAVDSNSHSGNSVSSNAICNSDDEKIKVEDEMAKNYIVKRKKESNEGNMES